MAAEQQIYTVEWAVSQYPQVCQSCTVVTEAVAELLPAIHEPGISQEDKDLATLTITLHAQQITQDCIRSFLAEANKLEETWEEGEDCWLKTDR